jgi:hypothetical protein
MRQSSQQLTGLNLPLDLPFGLINQRYQLERVPPQESGRLKPRVDFQWARRGFCEIAKLSKVPRIRAFPASAADKTPVRQVTVGHSRIPLQDMSRQSR